MKKIVYIMNVDWRWIKQRPHFIAEGLAKNFDVTVLYQYRYNRKSLQKRNHNVRGISIKPIYVIPKGDRHRLLRKVNKSIKIFNVKKNIRKSSPDFVIATYPEQVGFIPEKFSGRLIYDCMDNHIAFISNEEQKHIMMQDEAKLIKRADVILVSSEKLKWVLVERYGNKYLSKMRLIRNGYKGSIMDTNENVCQRSKDNELLITYFGTVSTWFDFDILQKSLEDFKNLRYKIIGPITDGVDLPKSDRIKFAGIVEHDRLYSHVEKSDCLLMPFKVNDIIESVDPVKLYEYINFNKNIICVKYKEVERFQPFVHFYSDYDSFKEQIQSLLDNENLTYSQAERIDFLQNNNWDNRINMIIKILNNEE